MLIAPFNTDAIFTATFVVLTSASISVACRRHYKWSIIEESERAGGESSTPDRLNDLILLTALLSVVGGFILLAEVMTTLPAGRDMSYTVFTAGITTITSTAILFVGYYCYHQNKASHITNTTPSLLGPTLLGLFFCLKRQGSPVAAMVTLLVFNN